jgi:hypothetical protein
VVLEFVEHFTGRGLDYDAAIARIAELRAGTRKAAESCPESPSQHRVLRERAAMRRTPKGLDS